MRYRSEGGRIMRACVFFREPTEEADFLGSLRHGAPSGVRTFELDAAALHEAWQYTAAVWTVLRCADYFGYAPAPGERVNWDALLDGLRSLDADTSPAKDYLLIVRNAALLWHRLPRVAGTFTELWQSAADYWVERLHTSFDLLYIW